MGCVETMCVAPQNLVGIVPAASPCNSSCKDAFRLKMAPGSAPQAWSLKRDGRIPGGIQGNCSLEG